MEKRLTHTIKGFKQVGVLRRAHGKDGLLRCSVDDLFLDDLIQSNFVFLDIEGSKVPYQVEELYGGPDYFIQLEEVDTPEEAAFLAGRHIYLPLIDISISEEEINSINDHPYVHFTIYDQTKKAIGIIQNVELYPQQEMAIVSNGTNQILIPLHDDLITTIDEENKKLHMRLPEGLLDLTEDEDIE